jgi:hypothetical protein
VIERNDARLRDYMLAIFAHDMAPFGEHLAEACPRATYADAKHLYSLATHLLYFGARALFCQMRFESDTPGLGVVSLMTNRTRGRARVFCPASNAFDHKCCECNSTWSRSTLTASSTAICFLTRISLADLGRDKNFHLHFFGQYLGYAGYALGRYARRVIRALSAGLYDKENFAFDLRHLVEFVKRSPRLVLFV